VPKKHVCHESAVRREIHADRWSKNLVGTRAIPTTGGFSLGLAVYTETVFGERQRHEDQEALYVVSGVGEILLGDEVLRVRPGSAAYVPPGVVHATRRTGKDSVKVVYAHGAI